MIKGLSHITLIVENMERSSLFFTKVFGAKEIYASGDEGFSLAREKFYLLNDVWICVMQGCPPVERTYSHVAFRIDENDFDDYLARIIGIGAQIKEGRPRVLGEGRSIYFYDFDNHLFELHTGTLQERLTRYSQGR